MTCLVTRPPLCSSGGSWEKYIRLVPAWSRLLMKGIMCFFEHPPLVCSSRGLQTWREIVNVSECPRYNTRCRLLSPAIQTQELLNRPRDVELRFAQFPASTQVFDLILCVYYCKIVKVEKWNIYIQWLYNLSPGLTSRLLSHRAVLAIKISLRWRCERFETTWPSTLDEIHTETISEYSWKHANVTFWINYVAYVSCIQ